MSCFSVSNPWKTDCCSSTALSAAVTHSAVTPGLSRPCSASAARSLWCRIAVRASFIAAATSEAFMFLKYVRSASC